MASLLERTEIGALVSEKREIISVPDTATVLDALELMNANGIIALPVAAPPGKWLGAGGANIIDGEKQYIGVVSMADVAMHVVKERAKPGALKAGVVSLIGNSAEGMSLWVASSSTPLVDAMEPLSKGIHRLLVRCPIAPAAADSASAAAPAVMTFGHTTPEEPEAQEGAATPSAAAGGARGAAEGSERAAPAGTPSADSLPPATPATHSYHFVSQTDVVAFLLLHLDELGTVVQRTVEQLGLVDPLFPPLAIVPSLTVTDALRLMQRASGVRAVAVVEGSGEEEEAMEEGEGSGSAGADMAGGEGGGGGGRARGVAGWVRGGRLLGTLSVSDLRGMDADTLAQLTSMKVRDFLAHMASLTLEGRRPSITCRMAAPLAEVMALAVTNRVHRVWVTSEDDELLGVVSLTDVIAACRRAGGPR